MDYSYLKALHLIFIVTWFSGLFYIVRLFVYHREAQELITSNENNDEKLISAKILKNQYTLMEKRLWYGITCPSALLVSVFGLSMVHEVIDQRWLHIKFVFLIFLFAYHFYCGLIRKQLLRGSFNKSSQYLRLINEIATLLLIAIVFIAVLKDALSMLKASAIFILICALLFAAIFIYKKFRSRQM